MACITEAIAFFRFLGTSSTSFPANRASAHTLSECDAMPFISRASVNTNPPNCNSWHSVFDMILCDTDAGWSLNSGTCRCPTMTPATPASIPFLKGGSSIESRRSLLNFSVGKALCESTLVSPCPGKCLHTAITPPSCRPLT